MIRAVLVQFSPRALEPADNFQRMAQIIDAQGHDADLIVFPELSNTGYVEPVALGGSITANVPDFGMALWQACADLHGTDIERLSALAAKHHTYLVLGLGLRDAQLRGVMRNASVLIGPQGVIGVYVKVHQWQNEKLYF